LGSARHQVIGIPSDGLIQARWLIAAASSGAAARSHL
jgi:hypothetical protein